MKASDVETIIADLASPKQRKVCRQVVIEVLSGLLFHPNKPGYMRRDIQDLMIDLEEKNGAKD